MELLKKLENKEVFTDTERKIVDYIIENVEDIPNMYVKQLASLTYSSHSAIIRLSKKLGFSGYRDFKIALIHEIQSNKHTLGSVDASFPFLQKDTSTIIAKKIAELSIETIRKTLNTLDKKTLNEAIKFI